jgi:hypothetical protein
MRASLGSQRAARARRRAPSGVTPSWFTSLAWFLEYEADLLARGIIPRPFDCDPCAHPQAPVSLEIHRRGGAVWTVKENGLAQSWRGRVVFENPAYNTVALLLFGQKRLDELHRAAGGLSLLPLWSDRDWFQDLVKPALQAGDFAIDFLPGRHRFGWPGNPHGKRGTQAMFASVTLQWRAR